MSLSTAKAVDVLFNDVLDQMEKQQSLAMLAQKYNASGAELQNAQNVLWRQIQQQSAIKEGWTFTDGDFGDIIEMSYPTTLGDPQNSLHSLRADDFRDKQFMERAAIAAATRLLADQNQRVAGLVRDTGSIYYRATVDGTSGNTGYDAIKLATTILSERQANTDFGVSMFLNDRNAQLISSDVANRSNMNGMPESTYKNGMIAANTAGLDLYESSVMPSITGGASPSTTVATTVSQGPVANQVIGGQILPVDYRISDDIAITDASGFVVGDWASFPAVESLGLQDKTPTGEDMTFKIVEITGNNIKVYPRPIAADDAGLTDDEKAFANINTQITAGTAIVRLNTDTSKRGNIFWTNDSVEILNADAPIEYLGELDGMTVKKSTLSSGTTVYMAYQGSINDMSLKCRLFTWYGLVNRDPSRNGMFVIN